MNNLSSTQFPVDVAGMAGISRLIRQVCLLREQGDEAGAARLQQGEMAVAVLALRSRHGVEALSESKLEVMFAAEERRVAEAVILSELLIPRLVGSLPAAIGAGRSPATRSTPGSLPVTQAPPVGSGPPAIPDLLDAMLAAERHGRRPAPATKRES